MAENIELTAQELAENELLNDAIAYAATMHRNGLRKGHDYALHRASAGGDAYFRGNDRRQASDGCRCAA